MPDAYTCKFCGRSLSHCICSVPRDPNTRALLAAYVELRAAGIAVEQAINADGVSAEDVKRLDKAVTVMKVGFKMVKTVLRKRGLTGPLKERELPAPLDQPLIKEAP